MPVQERKRSTKSRAAGKSRPSVAIANRRPSTAALLTVLFLALLATYSNHFSNGFHFDDSHTIVDNPAIRSLANIPRFFTDTTTNSSNPLAQSYRPLVTTSLAIDYALGHGLNPFWFHLSTFLWFAVQIAFMYALSIHILDRANASPRNRWLAWFATALYALHPASAETVNYIVQRADLYVALGIVAGLVVYARWPSARRYGLYLLPPLAAMFAKPPALVFAPILLVYILLIDRPHEALLSNLRRAIPAFALCAAFAVWEKIITPPTFFHTTLSSFDYWITQPYVTLRYFRSFFVPLYLNVDTDLPAFHSLWNPLALAGCLFCALLIAAAIYTARKPAWRPVSFGLWWFLLALIPTALYPLNEVENDHRMFLPFIGLSLAVVAAAAILVPKGTRFSTPTAAVAFTILAVFACLTHTRNEAWHTDESLWRDDIEKSPNNARGHYNLGVLLAKTPSRSPEAIEQFEAAIRIKPDYADAHIDLGVVLASTPGHLADAIHEYQAALRINPDSAGAHTNLANALAQMPDRLPYAIAEYESALRLNPGSAEAHFNLAYALARSPNRLPDAVTQYEAALRIRSGYADAHTNLGVALLQLPGRHEDAIRHYEAALRINPDSEEAHVNLGEVLSKTPGRMPEAIAQYEAAIRINPSSAAAHYDLGIALAKIPGRLPDAINEYEAAIRIRPDYADAHTNLGVALSQLPGRLPDAVSEFETVVRTTPDSAMARANLDAARQMLKRSISASGT